MRPALPLAFLALVTAGGCAGRCCAPPLAAAAPRRAPAASVAPTPPEVFLDSSIVRVPSATLAGDATPGARVLGTQEAVALVAAWRADSRSSVLAMPKILAISDQEATLFVGETPAPEGPGPLSFSVEGDDWTGYRMRTTPTVSADGRSVRLSVVFESRDADSGGPRPVVRGVARDVVVPEGSSLLLVSSPARGDQVEVTVVEPRILRGTAAAPVR